MDFKIKSHYRTKEEQQVEKEVPVVNDEEIEKDCVETWNFLQSNFENGLKHLSGIRVDMAVVTNSKILFHPGFTDKLFQSFVQYQTTVKGLFEDIKLFNAACCVAEAEGGETFEDHAVTFLGNGEDDGIINIDNKQLCFILATQASERIKGHKTLIPEVQLLNNLVIDHWNFLARLYNAMKNTALNEEINDKIMNSLRKLKAA